MVTDVRHVLTITVNPEGLCPLEGHLLFADGTETRVYGDERERVIAQAQEMIQRRRDAQELEPETVILDAFGELVREPVAHSVRVASVSSDPRDGYVLGDPKRIVFDRGPNGGI